MTNRASSYSGGANAKPTHDWQRFWISRTGTLDLSDGGFLVDPTRLPRSSGTDPRPLMELAVYQALALLGEPGGVSSRHVLAPDKAALENRGASRRTLAPCAGAMLPRLRPKARRFVCGLFSTSQPEDAI
jgi:hypothetical protein